MLEYKSEINTFLKIVKEYDICIPIIQRDYVQGIDDSRFTYNEKFKISDKKNQFLNLLLLHIEECKILSINMIYGFVNKSESNVKKTFYPVDGQQRLTTLFLLYWYLNVVCSFNNNNDIYDENWLNIKLTYETRESAKDFFDYICERDHIHNIKKFIEHIDSISLDMDLVMKKNIFVHEMMNQYWFKPQWFTDITVMSSVNIIADFYSLISKDKVLFYYDTIRNKDIIVFDFIINTDEYAEKQSSIEYIRLNSRGKQLDFFENIKPMLEQLNEVVIGKSEEKFHSDCRNFVLNYDMRYVNLFYDIIPESEKMELQTLQTQIDKRSIGALINLYNIQRVIYKMESSDSLPECMGENEFYKIIYNNLKYNYADKKSLFLREFWLEYFELLNFVMNSIEKNLQFIDYIERALCLKKNDLLNKEFELKNLESHNNRFVIYLRFIYWSSKNKINSQKWDEIYVTTESLKDLDYLLDTLKYIDWKECYYENTDVLVQHITNENYSQIFDYFLNDKNKVIDELKIGKIEGVDDIQIRIIEQCHKAKIIKYINDNISEIECLSDYNNKLNYNYFKKLEIREYKKGKKKHVERSIYYLLKISNLWNSNINIEKVKKFLDYTKAADVFFLKEEKMYEWRKIFALATYYDENSKELLMSQQINNKAEERYPLIKENDYKGKHFWNNDYYFAKDEDEFEGLKQEKLNQLRIAYDLFITNHVESLKESLLKSEYNTCWLKYAILRNGNLKYENLLTNPIRVRKGKVEIEVEKTIQYSWGSKPFQNYFAYVYLLDKQKEKWYIIKYCSWVYDIDSRNVSETKTKQNYTIYDDVKETKFIHGFQLNLLWQDEYEFNRRNDRRFYYYMPVLTINGDGDTLFSIDKDKLVRRNFCMNKYTESYYDLNSELKSIANEKDKVKNLIIQIEDLYNMKSEQLLKLNQLEQAKINILKSESDCTDIDEQIDKVKKLSEQYSNEYERMISNNFKCVKEYKNSTIHKYLYKSTAAKILEDKLFETGQDMCI